MKLKNIFSFIKNSFKFLNLNFLKNLNKENKKNSFLFTPSIVNKNLKDSQNLNQNSNTEKKFNKKEKNKIFKNSQNKNNKKSFSGPIINNYNNIDQNNTKNLKKFQKFKSQPQNFEILSNYYLDKYIKFLIQNINFNYFFFQKKNPEFAMKKSMQIIIDTATRYLKSNDINSITYKNSKINNSKIPTLPSDKN